VRAPRTAAWLSGAMLVLALLAVGPLAVGPGAGAQTAGPKKKADDKHEPVLSGDCRGGVRLEDAEPRAVDGA